MNRSLFLTGLLTVSALAIVGCASETNTNTARGTVNGAVNTTLNAANTVANTVSNTAARVATESPEDFLKNAAQAGMMEVEMAKVAASKAQHPEVKKFAQMMVTDHTKTNTEVSALAGAKNVTLPKAADMDRSDVEDLRKQSGTAFDSAFIEAMIDDHETDIAAFQRQADGSTDPEVKAFAAKTLPTLKAHLASIKNVQMKIASSQKME